MSPAPSVGALRQEVALSQTCQSYGVQNDSRQRKCSESMNYHGDYHGIDDIKESSSGDVPRVNGQLAVSRAFGDKSLKSHLRSDPDVQNEDIDSSTDLLILASDGLWKVMSYEDAVNLVRKAKEPLVAAKQLTSEALNRDSEDDYLWLSKGSLHGHGKPSRLQMLASGKL